MKKMKWAFVAGLASMFAVMMLYGFTQPEEAAQPEITPEATAQVVVVQIVPTPPPAPAPTREPQEIEITEHAINEADVEIIARLLWSSPLRRKTSKAALAWVVCNRVDSDTFPSTIAEVVTKTEFAFYDKRAHLSEENLQIASLVMNQWLSERDGLNAGRLVPANGLFIRFCGEDNRSMDILDARGGTTVYYPAFGAYDYE